MSPSESFYGSPPNVSSTKSPVSKTSSRSRLPKYCVPRDPEVVDRCALAPKKRYGYTFLLGVSFLLSSNDKPFVKEKCLFVWGDIVESLIRGHPLTQNRV